MLNTHRLQEYDGCYKEKYFTKTIFADRTGIQAKQSRKAEEIVLIIALQPIPSCWGGRKK